MKFASHLLLASFSHLSLGKPLWSSQPANASDVLRTAYPIGNGLIGILPCGEPGHEFWNINRDSLWSGGPFENSSYRGGNAGPRHQYLPGIRDWIWQNGTGNVSALQGDGNNYGSYAVLGNLTVSIEPVANASNYKRALDLNTGIHTTTYSVGRARFQIDNYCSYPDQVCVYDINSTSTLPNIRIAFSNQLTNASLVGVSCSDNQVQIRGRTQADIGMIYQATAAVIGHDLTTRCSNNSLYVPKHGAKRLTFVLAAGTDFDQSNGNAASNFSFRRADPTSYVQNTLEQATSKTPAQLLQAHVLEFQALMNTFSLDLPDTHGSAELETADLVSRYNSNSTAGDPYLESLTFDLARYLFISSSRDGSLPPNLQGKWATGLTNAWSADYHVDINLEMNHWHVDQTGLGDLQNPLWQYITQNVAPRGRETANLTYDAPGWVTHSLMNAFGSTGMQPGNDYWFDYPISGAWLMQHVWDYFDYSQDVKWLKETGYPLLKDVSMFWLSQLQEDRYFKDGTLVVNPCSSAEHGPTTFGCTHYQQLIFQLFETTLQDQDLIASLQTSLSRLDHGLHIGSWGQIQEWKLDLDVENDTHRHLSNLVGWYPSFSLSSYLDGYANTTIQAAVATTLYSRGPGLADDNAGWEKVWRAACWARLNHSGEAHRELRLTIGENWAPNLLSMYSGRDEPFQIDANFGFAGAVLEMLVADLPVRAGSAGERTIVLGPAIPAAWAGGRVRGLRLRGGARVDFEWDGEGVVRRANATGRGKRVRIVNKVGDVLDRIEEDR